MFVINEKHDIGGPIFLSFYLMIFYLFIFLILKKRENEYILVSMKSMTSVGRVPPPISDIIPDI